MKKTAILLAVILSFAMCFTFGASAEILAEFEQDGISYEIYRVGMEVGIAVTDVDEELSGNVTFPQNFDDVQVKKIGSNAFSNCTAITEVVIPSTVYQIGDNAFSGCTALGTVTLGSGVKDIGKNIFSGCASLEKITVAEGNTAFSTDENGALYNLNKTALVYCPSYVAGESCSIAEGVTTVKSGAFCDCAELKNLTIASTVDVIEAGAFEGSGIYDDQANWENGALYIGEYLIEVNTAEESFEIKEGTAKVAQKAFVSSEVAAVSFPESMLKIADSGAFFDSKVNSCYIPSTVEEIDRLALNGLTVYYAGTQEQWNTLSGENGILAAAVYFNHLEAGHSFTNYQSDNNATLLADGTKTAYCDYGCGEKDTVADEGSMIAFVKPESVTSVTTPSSITLNWTAMEGATGYRIYYMTANGWKKCATLTGTTHTFSNLKAGAKFNFAVRAYNIDGDVLTWAPSYTTHETAVQPEMPAKITSTQNEDGIRLTWTAVKGATGYRVYIKTAEGWKKRVDTVKTTQTMLNFDKATKYTFAVRPFIKTADTVIWGSYRTYQGATSPSYTNVEDFKNESGTITIGCNGGKGADVWEFYYKKPEESKYKLYARTKEYKSYTFNNLTGGTKFDFIMRAGVYKEDGIAWSHYSSCRVKVNYRIDRYVDFVNRGQFGFVAHDGNGAYTTVAVKNYKYCVEVRADGQKERMLFDEPKGYCYLIDDTNKLYYAEKDEYAAREAYYSTRELFLRRVEFKTTKETSGGKTYIVESYSNNGATLKYYFDGANLVKEVGIMDGEILYTTYYTKFSKTVSDSYFTVPSNYTRVTA